MASPNAKKAPTLTKRETEIGDDVSALLALSDKALDKDSFTPAVNARARAAGLRAELRRAEWARATMAEPDELERVRMRISAATEDGSWAAVGSLSSLEREIVALRKAQADAEAERQRLAADPEGILTALLEAVRELPAHMRDRLRDML